MIIFQIRYNPYLQPYLAQRANGANAGHMAMVKLEAAPAQADAAMGEMSFIPLDDDEEQEEDQQSTTTPAAGQSSSTEEDEQVKEDGQTEDDDDDDDGGGTDSVDEGEEDDDERADPNYEEPTMVDELDEDEADEQDEMLMETESLPVLAPPQQQYSAPDNDVAVTFVLDDDDDLI